MTPKEKAENLFNKYYNIDNLGYKRDSDGYIVWTSKVLNIQAKQCALIAVDELLLHEAKFHSILDGATDYLQQVKKEIEKM